MNIKVIFETSKGERVERTLSDEFLVKKWWIIAQRVKETARLNVAKRLEEATQQVIATRDKQILFNMITLMENEGLLRGT